MSKRRRTDTQNSMIGEFFTFALFGMFLLLSLLVVVIAAGGYRTVVATADTATEVRTCLGYVAGRVRSDVATKSISIEEMNGTPVLLLVEEYDGEEYATLIYHYEGSLYESVEFVEYMEPEFFDPEFGERLTAIAGFHAGWADKDLLRLTVTATDGYEQTLCLALRAGQGEAIE